MEPCRLLQKATHIILDEVHERDLQTDFLLIIVKDLLIRRYNLIFLSVYIVLLRSCVPMLLSSIRPDVKVILMSATLNADMFSAYFGEKSNTHFLIFYPPSGHTHHLPLNKPPLPLHTHTYLPPLIISPLASGQTTTPFVHTHLPSTSDHFTTCLWTNHHSLCTHTPLFTHPPLTSDHFTTCLWADTPTHL